jgi:hypothetical protein
MIHTSHVGLIAAAGLFALAAAGCGTPDALQRSQRLQLDAMVQYRTEMAAYHEKVKTRLVADKRRELDAALTASLTQAADAAGKVAVTVVADKVGKRQSLEQEFLANLARLDGEFQQRQAAIDRAIDLARGSLALINNYSQLGTAVRNLFVREVESTTLVNQYELEGSPNNAGSPVEPSASGT